MYSYTTQSARNLNVPAFPYCNNSALYNMIMLMRRKTHTNKHISQLISFGYIYTTTNMAAPSSPKRPKKQKSLHSFFSNKEKERR